jgi:hypothetical protein
VQLHVDADRRRRQAERVRQMEKALRDARRRGDGEAARLLAAWLDAEYVSRAYVRARDPEVLRLRRLLRTAS